MIKHKDGSISDLPVIRASTLPANVKQEDSLLNATSMSKQSVDLFCKILENVLKTHYKNV